MPNTAEPWSLTSLRGKLIKIGAKVVSHGRYVTFQMAEVAMSRQMFQEIQMLIARLRARSRPSSWWRFETEDEAPRVGELGGKWSAFGAPQGQRDRRHGGLCCDRSATIKPCAFGAPLRGCGA